MAAALSEFGLDISGTSAERTALIPKASIGMRFFDTTVNSPYFFNGTDWQQASTHTSVKTGLTALIGGGQPGATAITGGINRFDTVASPGDSGQLFQATAIRVGERLTVVNNTSNSLNVFPFLADQINGLGANAAIAVGGNKSCDFICTAVGQWNSNLSA